MKTIFKNGTYERVSNEVADYEVRMGKAKYASKIDWKKNTRSTVNVKSETKSKKAMKAAKFKSKQRQYE